MIRPLSRLVAPGLRSFALGLFVGGFGLVTAGCTPRGGAAPSDATAAASPTAGEGTASAPPATSGEEPTGVFVDKIDLVVSKSLPVEVRAELRGHLADTCVELGEAHIGLEGRTYHITFEVTRPQGKMCAQMLVPFRRGVEVPVIDVPKGTYQVVAYGRQASFTLYQDNTPPARMR